MAQIYGQIDSLTQLQDLLNSHNITFLSSLKEIIEFYKQFSVKLGTNKKDIEQKLKIEIDDIKNNISILSKDYEDKIIIRKKELNQEKKSIKLFAPANLQI